MKTKLLLGLTGLIMIMSSCNKKDESPEPENPAVSSDCIIATTKTDYDSTTYKYSNGKLKKVYNYVDENLEDSMIFNYGTSEIIITNYASDGSVRRARKLTVGINGLATKETSIEYESSSTKYDTSEYEYDSNNYLIKETIKSSDGILIGKYVITDGNMTSDTTIENGTATDVIDYEYYTDKENKSVLDNYGFPNSSITFYGKANKNLTKSIIHKSSSESLTYEFDSKGYVTKAIVDAGANINHFVYTYTCP